MQIKGFFCAAPKKMPKAQQIKIADEKESNLRSLMREMKSVLVAYSGGVDSAYLALIATQELGDKAHCITGISPSVSLHQKKEAEEIARKFKFNFETICTDELENPDYQKNPTNRCYFCKTELYGKLTKIATDKKINHVIDGTNFDDLSDYRPGRIAAEEKSVRSPLIEVGLKKKEIRELSLKHALPSWDKPASPCLSSRITHGVPVTIERLSKVERGEKILREMGFREFRVRVHDELARIEIAPEEFEKVLNIEKFKNLSDRFIEIGFRYVTLDLQGYRVGKVKNKK